MDLFRASGINLGSRGPSCPFVTHLGPLAFGPFLKQFSTSCCFCLKKSIFGLLTLEFVFQLIFEYFLHDFEVTLGGQKCSEVQYVQIAFGTFSKQAGIRSSVGRPFWMPLGSWIAQYTPPRRSEVESCIAGSYVNLGSHLLPTPSLPLPYILRAGRHYRLHTKTEDYRLNLASHAL